MGLLDDLGNLAKKAQNKLEEAAAKLQGRGPDPTSRQPWYYTTDGKSKQGPLSFDQLKKLAQAGELKPSHMVRQEGMLKWVMGSEVPALWATEAHVEWDLTPIEDAVPLERASAAPPPIDAGEQWYYAVAGRQAGPVTAAQLRSLVATGQLTANDLVWKAGMAAWGPAGSIPGLVPTPPTLPPPLPPMAASPGPPALPPTAASAEPAPQPSSTRVTGELNLVGRDGWGREPLHIMLDDEEIGTKTWAEGIHHLLFETTVGHHTVTLQDGDSKYENKAYQVDFGRPGHYMLEFKTGWLLVEFPTALDVRYASSTTKAVPVPEVRRKMLLGRWICADGSLEFTADGAAIFHDGSVGEYQFTGKEIHFLLTDGRSREFKVLSLSKKQLVIAEGKAATTFRRPQKAASAPAAAQDVSDQEIDDDDHGGEEEEESTPDEAAGAPANSGAASGSAKSPAGAMLGGFWNWLSGKDKCPQCGSRNTKRLETTLLERRQEVRSDYDAAIRHNLSTPPQAVFNLSRLQAECQCNACQNHWAFTYIDSTRA